MSLSESEKDLIVNANKCEKSNDETHIYKYDVGNNAHLVEDDMTHDFSQKIDVDKQVKLDLARSGKRQTLDYNIN
jgi:hypothetical protein